MKPYIGIHRKYSITYIFLDVGLEYDIIIGHNNLDETWWGYLNG